MSLLSLPSWKGIIPQYSLIKVPSLIFSYGWDFHWLWCHLATWYEAFLFLSFFPFALQSLLLQDSLSISPLKMCPIDLVLPSKSSYLSLLYFLNVQLLSDPYNATPKPTVFIIYFFNYLLILFENSSLL